MVYEILTKKPRVSTDNKENKPELKISCFFMFIC